MGTEIGPAFQTRKRLGGNPELILRSR
jgi:hypothetical protein